MNARKTSLHPLARAGAALALALGAAQAGAVTYTVPLQFNITLAPSVCSLTVGGVTADATTPTPTTGAVVNLTPTALSAVASPNALVQAMSGLVDITASGPGIHYVASPSISKRMSSPPTASVTCSPNTPMTAKLARVSTAGGGIFSNGIPGAGQSGTLPIGMAIGIASFAGTTGATGGTVNATTYASMTPTVAATASGSAQALNLEVGVYGSSTTALNASYAGLWLYQFSVSLDF